MYRKAKLNEEIKRKVQAKVFVLLASLDGAE